MLQLQQGTSLHFSTGKAAGEGFNMPVDGVEDVYLLLSRLPHLHQKGVRDVQRVAFLPFGVAVQYRYFHLISLQP